MPNVSQLSGTALTGKLPPRTARPRKDRLQVMILTKPEADVIIHSGGRGDRGIDLDRLSYDIELGISATMDLLESMFNRELLYKSRDKHGRPQYMHTSFGLRSETWTTIQRDLTISKGLANAVGIRKMKAGEQPWDRVQISADVLERLLEIIE